MITSGAPHRADPRSTATLAAYGLPALPLAALALPLYVLVPTYYAAHVGLSLAVVGTVLLVIRLLDAALDPLIGVWSDRFASRFGRRRGFFLLSLPLTALSTFMLFSPPDGAGVVWLAVWGLLASVGFTMTMLPHAAWGAELATDYHGRAKLSAWREGFTLLGTLLAILLPFVVDSSGGHSGLGVLGITLVILLPAFGLLAVWRVPEPVDFTRQRLGMAEALRYLGANRPFVRLVVAFLANGFANAIPATLFLNFVGSRIDAPEMQGPFLFLYFLSAIAGVPLALFAARRFGKHRAWCWGMLAACAIFSFSGFLGQDDLIAFGVICVLTGVLLGFDLSIPPSIQADVIDADTVASGEQRSGVYFAAWALVTKLASALAVGIVFPLLAWGGFDALGRVQSPTALTTLSVLYAWLPILPKLIAIALMWNFPLDAKEQAEIRARLEASQA